MAPSSSTRSGEIFGHHLMPGRLDVDFLLPNGIFIIIECARDMSLDVIKQSVWQQAVQFPLFELLQPPSAYVFVSVISDGELEEFYDETRRLCDLRLFQPFLKLTEVRGNKEEKMLCSDISFAISLGVHELDAQKDLEVLLFRGSLMQVCKSAVEERRKGQGQALYCYPPDKHGTSQLPPHIAKKLQKNLLVCVWVVSEQSRAKFTIKVAVDATVQDVIIETMRVRLVKLNKSAEEQKSYLQMYKNAYVLKQCGCNSYLLDNCKITQYKYVRHCIARERIPQVMLVSYKTLLDSLPALPFVLPSYATKGQAAYEELIAQDSLNLWSLAGCVTIYIKHLGLVNVKDNMKVFVYAGIYHGVQPLCDIQHTNLVDNTRPKWNQTLTFNIMYPDLPRCSRLCLSVALKKKDKEDAPFFLIGWANLNMFDFSHHLCVGHHILHLWPVPQGLEDPLNPIGASGSNPNPDSLYLDIVVYKENSKAIKYPSEQHLLDLAQYRQSLIRPRANSASVILTTSKPTPSLCASNSFDENLSSVASDEDLLLQEIMRKDPLCELSEQDLEILWMKRYRLIDTKEYGDLLPKLLHAVKWSSREDVVEFYYILSRWSLISVEAALQLLYCSVTDLKVRQFAVNCLEKVLSDEQLSTYLLQLVQVLKFEPYYDSPLTRFLLRRSLLNQNIGHFFFWHLKSEMQDETMKLRFALILEAYVRSCDLKYMCRQVEVVNKLTKLTDQLKELKDEVAQVQLMSQYIRRDDYQETLQHLTSPLNCSQVLGDLIVSRCRPMASKKRPLWLVWTNPDPMCQVANPTVEIIFKNGDDLRQDMLTLQIIRIMDSIWQSEGLDLQMTPYCCLATGGMVGLIEAVQHAATIMTVHERSISTCMGFGNKALHAWIKERNKDRYQEAIESFTVSCAGYSVATFVLGIGDRHPDNIMVTESGQVFHIDFGHFLNHRKKKYGINRERVPFVLTSDFLNVIAKGASSPENTPEFAHFQELCVRAYLALRNHATVFITLLVMMLSGGIPELQTLNDIGYVRKTLQVDKTEEEAKMYFLQQVSEAYNGSRSTKIDWLAHWLAKSKA